MGWRMSVSGKCALIRLGEGEQSKAHVQARKRKEEYLAPACLNNHKDRVIMCTRVLGIPVPSLARAVLEETFDETGLERSIGGSQAAKYLRKDTVGALASNKFPMVFGWGDLRLNGSSPCSGCDQCVKPASFATFGIIAPGEERIILCEYARSLYTMVH
jgi:hypothetical protein